MTGEKPQQIGKNGIIALAIILTYVAIVNMPFKNLLLITVILLSIAVIAARPLYKTYMAREEEGA